MTQDGRFGAPAIERNFGTPTAYKPSLLDEILVKVTEFSLKLGKKMFIVFIGILLDKGSKALMSKVDDSLKDNITGAGAGAEKKEHDREKLYGNRNNYNDQYSRYEDYGMKNNYNKYDKAPSFLN